jgi:diaminopimelate epimerase
MNLLFTKMQGIGNDFVVIDAVRQNVQLSQNQVRLIADRHFGIGCDQILLVEPPSTPDYDFFYRIYNADGSESGQCGNGARCLAIFLRDQALTDKLSLDIQTNTQQMQLDILESNIVRVSMGIPSFAPKDVPLMAEKECTEYEIKINSDKYFVGAVSLGNPHVVQLVENLDSVAVSTLGSIIEKHSMFPERVNVGFMQVVNAQHIHLRVYERGAGETLACGSGACAAVVVGQKMGKLDPTVQVDLPGGRLTVEWQGDSHPVYLTGPATKVYEGQITL